MESIAESFERRGIEKGIEQGIEQGIERGIEQGQRTVVRRQLTKKFGVLTDDVLSRLDAATESELAEYADRLLDAQSLTDVFKS